MEMKIFDQFFADVISVYSAYFNLSCKETRGK